MLTAITREVSPAINSCELTYLARMPIDYREAAAQHRAYEQALRELGASVLSLPARPDWPDSVFVEDPAVVLDEVAVITRMGVESRRGEAESLAEVLARFRPLLYLCAPATLEGGDVVRIGRTLFVGRSPRTNAEGIAQFAAGLEPFGYSVQPVVVNGCMHLKSACCHLGGDAVLVNRNWIDAAALGGLHFIDVAADEPWAADVLPIGEQILMPDSFPGTRRILERQGWDVREVNVSELMKAEAGVTCMSLLFEG